MEIHFPSADQIYKETYTKLKEIEGWKEFNNKWDYAITEYISENGLQGWSRETLIVLWFDYQINNLTELFKDVHPKEPEYNDNEEITVLNVQQVKEERDKYIEKLKDWSKKLIEIAPIALEELPKCEIYEISIIGIPRIEYSGEDPAKFMNIAYSYKDEKKWDLAIEYLNKSYDAFFNSPLKYPLNYSIYDFVRLPLYMHHAGYLEESWETFQRFLDGDFPIRIPKKNGLENDIIKSWERRVIFSKMKSCYIKEKKYREALVCRCLDLYFDIAGLFLLVRLEKEIGKSAYDYEDFSFPLHYINTHNFYPDPIIYGFKECSKKSTLVKNLKTRARMAKLNDEVEVIAELISDAIKILPDYKLGEEIIINNLKKFPK
ncbi:hypothetical protein [Prochlorococcus marinus]|uniref:Uncharacterized protein n=1 Tax=Prochlorococcus marinus (strain MIT 9211) TaxID=93059 RepID=A9BE01_PROM4|nr:hypothetical protein [Prochlorococcus marinus]ABX08311.1 Hypothetical protein P9211_03801 [Prochlorococcus marinus str. MIT 9211]